MCGIIGGIVPKQTQMTRGIVRGLLLDNEERGDHSTGLAYKVPTGYAITKDAVPARTFVNRYSKILGGLNSGIFLGHTRFATQGAINARNAHPFSYNGLVFAHNGVIYNDEQIAKKYGLVHEVDSEVLGPIFKNEDWQTLAEVTGQAAVIAWDTKADRVYLYRHGNPLYMTLSGQGAFFSSLEKGLFVLTGEEPTELDSDTLYTIELDNEGYMGKVTEHKVEMKGYTMKSYGPYTDPYDYFDQAKDKKAENDELVCSFCQSELTQDELSQGGDKVCQEYGADYLCTACREELKELELMEEEELYTEDEIDEKRKVELVKKAML